MAYNNCDPTDFAISHKQFLAFSLTSTYLFFSSLPSLPTTFWNYLRKTSRGRRKSTLVTVTERRTLPLFCSYSSFALFSIMSMVLRGSRMLFFKKRAKFLSLNSSCSSSSNSIIFLSKNKKFLLMASSDSSSSR